MKYLSTRKKIMVNGNKDTNSSLHLKHSAGREDTYIWTALPSYFVTFR